MCEIDTVGSGRLRGAPHFAELNRGMGDVGIASVIQLTNGAYTTPSDIDRIQKHDGIYITVNETGSWITDITFNGLKGLPVFTEFIGRYQGNIGHNVDVLNRNLNLAQWDDTGLNLIHSVVDQILRFPFPAISTDYLLAGEAQTRFHHTSPPTGAHNLNLDEVKVITVGAAMPVIGPPVLIENWVAGENKDFDLDPVNGQIIPKIPGRYRIDILGSVLGTEDSEVHIHLFINDVLDQVIGCSTSFDALGNVSPIVGGGYKQLNVGDILTLKVFSNVANSYISFEHGIFRVEKVGG